MIVLVRHGRTDWNAQGRAQGWADVGLDLVGEEQAARTAARLAGVVPASSPVFASDLPRAVATARPIAAALGSRITVSDQLREVDAGRWQGLTEAQIAAVEPELYRRAKLGEDIRRGGGETYGEAGARVAAFISALAEGRDPDAWLVVVGHGKSMQWGLDQLAARGRIDIGGPAPHLGNGEYLVIDYRLPAPEGLASPPGKDRVGGPEVPA